MAVGQNLLFGRMQNKIGGVVTSTWKGINVIKGKPLTVANPKTDKQLMRRSAMSQTVAIGRVILGAISLGFSEQAIRKSAYNAFLGLALKDAFDYNNAPTALFNSMAVKVAQGTITPQDFSVTANSAASGFLVVGWGSNPLLPGQSNADIANVVLFNISTGGVLQFLSGENRAATSAQVPYPAGFIGAGDGVAVHLFFYSSSNRKASDSVAVLSTATA